MKVTIPTVENKSFYLVVIKIKSEEYMKDPMMLLTNMEPENEEFTKIVNKVYIRRWKIEEYFRFKKQQFGFEKELIIHKIIKNKIVIHNNFNKNKFYQKSKKIFF